MSCPSRGKVFQNMYTRFYGLTKKPFENTPDPEFLYLSENHREVLASLAYGVNSAKGLILAMGDVGTGKTTLINALKKQLDPSFVVVRITNPRLVFGQSTFTNILEYFASELGLDSDRTNNRDLLEAVTDELERLDRSGKKAILIIDEAHLLSEESLHDIRLLSNIENEKTKLIQILLIGQDELNSKLQKDSLKALKQRFNISRRLRPLNKSETGDYIMHRLRVAGRDSQIFDKRALDLIFKKSSGVPRLINQICDSSLLIGYAVEARSIGSKVVREVINDMNAVYEQQEGRSVSLLHRWRWSITWVGIALLIALTVATLTVDRRFFPWTRTGKDSALSRPSEISEGGQTANEFPQKRMPIADTTALDPGLLATENRGAAVSKIRAETHAVPDRPGTKKPQPHGAEPSGGDRGLTGAGEGLPAWGNGDGTGDLEGETVQEPKEDLLDAWFQDREEDNQEGVESDGYYKVNKGDSLASIAGLKAVYDDPLKWTSLLRLNLDTLGSMRAGQNFEHRELPEGLHLRFITPEEAVINLKEVKGKPWVINILSARTLERIVPYAVKLIKNGYHVYLTRTDIKGDEWIRLRVGFFKTVPDAVAAQKEIASILHIDDSWVTRIGKELEKYGGY
ncbi:MAG TPA: AAA family ATPase [Deltaproteobacteria bacterium]|nr:AAA family ATPase [Deltaproteobacteria bacterium]